MTVFLNEIIAQLPEKFDRLADSHPLTYALAVICVGGLAWMARHLSVIQGESRQHLSDLKAVQNLRVKDLETHLNLSHDTIDVIRKTAEGVAQIVDKIPNMADCHGEVLDVLKTLAAATDQINQTVAELHAKVEQLKKGGE